jgi:serine/threonine protein kinase
LHKGGLVHRDIHPGNIIVIDGVAKISDMGFVKERDVRNLGDRILFAGDSSSSAATEVRTVSLHRTPFSPRLTSNISQSSLYFAAVEVTVGWYLFQQHGQGGDIRDKLERLKNELYQPENELVGEGLPDSDAVATKVGPKRIFLHTSTTTNPSGG